MTEMWWISEAAGGSTGSSSGGMRGGREEVPRPSPIKPHDYPPAERKDFQAHGRLRDSDDAFLARLGLGLDESRDFPLPQKSRDFGGHTEMEEPRQTRIEQRQSSIDDLISEDVQFSNSIERLLNAYPKYPSQTLSGLRSSIDRGSDFRAGDSLRIRESIGVHSLTNSTQDIGESGTLKGLLLSLKLDGRAPIADKTSETGSDDRREMTDNLQAIIDSLSCLDEATSNKEEKGLGDVADNIQQVCALLHSDMATFTTLYDEKYANEDQEEERRKKRDEEMREEGRREKLKQLELENFRAFDRQEAATTSDYAELGKGEGENYELTSASLGSNVINGIKFGQPTRPVWSTKLGRYVIPPDPIAEERKESARIEEERLSVAPLSYQPFFPSCATSLNSTSGPCHGLSHGSITSAARAAIQICLSASEHALLIRLPEEVADVKVPQPTELEIAYDPSALLSTTSALRKNETPEPETNDVSKSRNISETDRTEGADEVKKGVDTETRDKPVVMPEAHCIAATKSVPVLSTTQEELNKLDAILGHDDEATVKFLAKNEEVTASPTVPSLGEGTTPPILTKFRSLGDIEEALSSKPSLPPPPQYEHNYFEQPDSVPLTTYRRERFPPETRSTTTSPSMIPFTRRRERGIDQHIVQAVSSPTVGHSPRGPHGNYDAPPFFFMNKTYDQKNNDVRINHITELESSRRPRVNFLESNRLHSHFANNNPRFDNVTSFVDNDMGRHEYSDKPGEEYNSIDHSAQERMRDEVLTKGPISYTDDLPKRNQKVQGPEKAGNSNMQLKETGYLEYVADSKGIMSSYHEKTVFLEKMKRLRAKMTMATI